MCAILQTFDLRISEYAFQKFISALLIFFSWIAVSVLTGLRFAEFNKKLKTTKTSLGGN